MSKYVQELQRRIPVWDTMSQLFLDTNLSNDDFECIADKCIESQYTINELEYIYRYEVSPSLWMNIRAIAGEWAFFETDWLVEKILKKIKGDLNMYTVHNIKLHPIQKIPLFIRQLKSLYYAKWAKHNWLEIKKRINAKSK